MEVATSGGEVLLSTRCFYGVDVEIAGRCLSADLRVLKMVDYDVIFGMDWLRRYRVHVQCFQHRVVFWYEGELEFYFRGSLSLRHQPFLSLLEARHLVNSSCDAFLACVTSSSIEEVRESSLSMYSVPIACEFPDVFPEDLPNLPPPREVEFSIDLCSNAVPHSKAPYQMSSTELHELKKQVQELLEQGFIQLSVSL